MSKAKIRAMADKVVSLTMAEATAKPGLLGMVMSCAFRENGYYDRGEKQANGSVLKVYYELKV
jgi:hypothetical protein